jgi:hypothetical protein
MPFFGSCKRITENTVSQVRNGDYEVLIRSQEFNDSRIRNVDICVTEGSGYQFPKDKRQCFLHGFDFNNLSVKWQSQRAIEVSFECGRVDQFRNSAFVYPKGPVPAEFYVTLRDSCDATNTHSSVGLKR